MAEQTTKYVYEVFALLEKAKTKENKIKILQENSSDSLKNILLGIFEDSITWLLPDTPPPYEPADPVKHPSNLSRQLNNLPYFVKGGKGADMMKVKREMMFIRMLETIHPEDAKIVLAMVAKKSPVKGLTKTLVKEASPNLIKS